MIVVALVVGVALALCVAGWVPLVRNALRPEHVLPGPSVREAAQAVVARLDAEPDALPEPVSA